MGVSRSKGIPDFLKTVRFTLKTVPDWPDLFNNLLYTDHEFPIKTADAYGSAVDAVVERRVVDGVYRGAHYGSRISRDPVQQRFEPTCRWFTTEYYVRKPARVRWAVHNFFFFL